MGTYRFILAILVALSHMGVSVAGGLNPGVFAVISFFLISGFVMTGLVRSHYMSLGLMPRFYLDRAARIFPQYLLFMVLTALALALLGLESPYLEQFSSCALWANVAVVPLDFFMFSPAIANFMLLPQAWSEYRDRGLVHAELGDVGAALRGLQTYLRHADHQPDREAIRARLDELGGARPD